MDATPESIVQVLLHTPLAVFAGKQLRDAGFKYLKDKLTAKETYQERLVERVREFLQRQNERFAVDFTRPQRYFWHSTWAWHHVLAYRFYETAPPTLLLADLPATPNMVPPTQAQLTQFCEELWAFLEEDAELRRLFAAENYQAEVFAGNQRLSQQLAELQAQLLDKLGSLGGARDSGAEVEKVLRIVENAYIRQFQPYSALKLLEQVGEHLLPDHEPELVAYYHFLQGLAYTEAGDGEQAHPHFVQARELRPAHPRYGPAALLSHAHYGTPATARTLAEELLARAPLNAAAHAVLVAQAGNEQLATNLAQLPAGMAENPDFRRHVLGLLPDVDHAAAELVFTSDLVAFPAPTSLTFDNRSYWALVAQFIVLRTVGNAPYEQAGAPPLPAEVPAQLRAAHEFLHRYCALLRPTEKYPLLGGYWYLLGLAGYYLTGSPADFASFQETFPRQPLATRQQYGPFYALLLARWAEPAEVLALLDQLPADEYGNADFLRYQQLAQLRQPEEAQASLAASLEKPDLDAATTYTRARIYLERYCPDMGSRTAWLAVLDQRGQLAPGLPGTYLLRAAACLADEMLPEVLPLLLQAEDSLGSLTAPSYLFDLAGLYSLALEYEKANALLLPELATADGRYLEQVTYLYLSNLYQQRTRSQELLARLRAWRQQHAPVDRFCRWELELAALSDNWPLLVEVARQAHAAFPAIDYFRWELVRGLHLVGDQPALHVEIRHLAATPGTLPREYALNVAVIAQREGLLAEALALASPLATDRNDVEARNIFTQLYLPNGHEAEAPPTEAAAGLTVAYTLGGEAQPPLALTDELLAAGRHPFAARLRGLRPGGRFSYADRSGVLKSGEVTALYGPYQALLLDIMRQSEEQRDTLQLQQFRVPEGDFRQLQATLIQQFGAGEDERRRGIEDLLEDVRAGRQGFSAVARGVCAGNGWDAYRLLTSAEGRGLRLMPAFFYAGIELRPELTYVLDWSTLPLFYHLHGRGQLTLPAQLWVPRQVPDFLRTLLAEKKRAPAPKLSVVISGGFVRPVFYADDYKDQEVAALTQLLAWVEQHCQTRLVPEKLDLLRQAQQEEKTSWLDDDENDYLGGSFDLLFLVNQPGTVVVSDDLTLLPLVQRHGLAVSSEYYLRTLHADTFAGHLLPELLRLRYVGLQVEAPALYRAFLAEGGRFLNSAMTYLASVGYDILVRGFTGATYLLDFLKQVYLTPTLLPDQKDRAALTLYAQALSHADQLTPALRRQLLREIYTAFRLLPQDQDRLLPVFRLAWQQAVLARRSEA